MTQNLHTSQRGPVRISVVGGTAHLIEQLKGPGLELAESPEVIIWFVGAEPAPTGPLPVLAIVDGPATLRRASEAGAEGIVSRTNLAGLAAAAFAVRAGFTVRDADATGSESHVALTAREKQVAELVAQGLSNKLIAARLDISDHTAKFHVNGLMAKLGVSTRTEAAIEAVRRGIVAL